MKKEGIVKTIKKGKTDNYGNISFYMTFEDDFSVVFKSKKDPQDKFTEGSNASIEYEVKTYIDKQGQSKSFNLVNFPKPAFNNGVKANPKECAMTNAVNLHIALFDKNGDAKILAIEKIKETFDKILNIISNE